jgi:hypothetical protein
MVCRASAARDIDVRCSYEPIRASCSALAGILLRNSARDDVDEVKEKEEE